MGLDKTARDWGPGCRYMHPESSYQWLIVKTESGAGNPENTTWEDRLIELHLLAKRESLVGYKCLWVQKRLLQSALVQSILTGRIRNIFTLLQRKIQTRQEKNLWGSRTSIDSRL